MASHMDIRKESVQSLFRSPKTEHFELVALYLGKGLKMAGHSLVILGKETWHGHC